jgi:glycosyltransferase involved in cell wall biosynthesis
MHVLWICGSRIVGGAERATLQIAALLRERGHLISAVCPPDSRVHRCLGELALPVQSAAIGGARNLRARAAITRVLAALTPDVALVTGPDEWVWACLSRRARTRLVLVRHMALPLSWRVRWLAARRADAVVAVSRAVRDSLRGRIAIPPHRLHVLYNPARFPPRAAVPTCAARAQARQALGLPTDGRWVGFFGGLDPNTGVRDVVRALRHADRMLGATRLLLCGRRVAAAPPGLAELAADRRLFDLGETERVEEALTASDVVVMATHRRLSEALPATLLEAMACGTPVLAYATGGMAEVVGDDGHAGRLARPDDPDDLARVLLEMLSDAAAADRMAAAGLARARDLFDPQRAADGYERLFAALCR